MGPSTSEYIFIRACITFLHWIAPLSIALSVAMFCYRPSRSEGFSLQAILIIWALLETAFYVVVFLPLRRHLQKPASHPKLVPYEQRRQEFIRCMGTVPDLDQFLSKWFRDSPLSEIKRENVKEFLRWAFLDIDDIDETYEEEVEEYVQMIEKNHQRKFEPGRGNAMCIRLTFDEVNLLHRSLFWYLCVFVVDCSTSVRLFYHGFDYHRTPLRHFFSVFPLRPHNAIAPRNSPSDILTYWHRPHNSKTRLPIVFVHGIGIGLYPYVDLLGEINKDLKGTDSDDESVGIIAIEIMPISFRLTGQALLKQEMCAEIDKILKLHGWDKFVLISHSYGSVVSTHLLHTPHIAAKIGPIILIDPVTFLLHLPDVAFNFLHRKPRDSNEHRLQYFASNDIGVAHTLSRRFFWKENIVWKEDFGDRPVTVVLCGKDMIVNTEHIGEYLAGSDDEHREKGAWKSQAWKGKGLDILWFEKLNHAEVFDQRTTRVMILRVIREYCVNK
ncbi:hypothetical protein D6C80_02436 [Aureobasidium pullulans]|nr:hypothetical protein D6C80_02436 [Aureobasidium pullulans]